MRAIDRPCSAINLDPANDNIPYEADVDVRELVNIEEVMAREELGPNGGILWAMEEVESEFAWLEDRLEECGENEVNVVCMMLVLTVSIEETVFLDPPGQPELTTHHGALPNILHRLEKIGCRVCFMLTNHTRKTLLTDNVVDCCDSTSRLRRSDPSKPLPQ